MTTNEALAKHNFISKINLKSKSGELSKELKVKVMSLRIELGKIRKDFDADLKEFADTIVPDEFRELAQKSEKTEEEIKKFEELNAKINEEYQAYIQERAGKEVDVKKVEFTEDEYTNILEVFDADEVDINGQKISPEDFLEIFYGMFVTCE